MRSLINSSALIGWNYSIQTGEQNTTNESTWIYNGKVWLLSSLMILATKWKPHWYLWASRCCVYSDLQGFSCGIPHENPQHHTRHFRPEFISFIMANVLFLVQKYKKVWSNLHFFHEWNPHLSAYLHLYINCKL